MHDLDAILARTDLAQLADELVGGRKGNGPSAKWPSPVPGHPQTGQSPPMGIYTDRHGIQRWKDFATGNSGTAIDLYMTVNNVDTKSAIEYLASRTNVQPTAPTHSIPTGNHRAGDRPATDGTPRLLQWVEETNALLSHPKARLAHKWLESHGIDLEHAIDNQLGYDPGAPRLRRGDGLPKSGPALVLPITDQHGDIIYAQSRNLRPGGPKYINPTSAIATNPTISILDTNHNGPMILTEGIADGLVATQYGHNAASLIGTGMTARDTWVEPLVEAAQGRPLLLAFDNDPAGHTAAQQATQQLRNVGINPDVLPVPAADISDWANVAGKGFDSELHAMIAKAEPLAPKAAPTAPIEPRIEIS